MTNKALKTILERIQGLGHAMQRAVDAYEVQSIQCEMTKAKTLQRRLIQRQNKSQKIVKAA